MKIFLLEDDFSLNESIKDMLESENFIVDSFYDGKVALDNTSGDYELFILDIFVPNLNGILLLEKICLDISSINFCAVSISPRLTASRYSWSVFIASW